MMTFLFSIIGMVMISYDYNISYDSVIIFMFTADKVAQEIWCSIQSMLKTS